MSSEVIDERVVSLKFDNKSFEKNASQSLTTIQKLKEALNFQDAQKSLEGLRKASNQFQLNGIGRSLDEIKDKFTVMEVAARAAIQNITNSFVNAATQWVKSITIEPVSEGFGVYETKMNSVQTILNNSGKSLREVNKILDELNTYSDQTIYSLNDMTAALGKFTAQGIDAAKAVEIIKGAANEAASMGAGSAEFSRVIYNLTQAYGMGKMTTVDWKSLEIAQVAGKKFKEELVEAAKALKTINEDGTFEGKLVTADNLRDFLSEGIITADVMTRVYEKYADTTTDLGKAASEAATQVKTFHQLMDVISESVASTWSKSFSYIIGDFYEAKRLWTNVSTIFEQTIGKINTHRNEVLEAWKEGFIDPVAKATKGLNALRQEIGDGDFFDTDKISGRTLLFDSFANMLQAILQVVRPIKEAFRDLFPATTAKNLWDMTKNLRDFTARLKLSDGAIKEIKDAAKGFFSIFKTARDIIKDVIGAIIPATKNVDSLAVIFLKLAGALGRLITKNLAAIKSSEKYKNVLSTITQYATKAIQIIALIVKNILIFVKAAEESGALTKVFNGLLTVIKKIFSIVVKGIPIVINGVRLIGAAIGSLMIILGSMLESFEGFFSKIFSKEDTKDASKNIESLENSSKDLEAPNRDSGVDEALSNEKTKSEKLVETQKRNKSIFQNIFEAVSTVVGNIVTIIQKTWPIVASVVTKVGTFAGKIMELLSSLSDLAIKIVNGLVNAFNNIDTITVMLIGIFTSINLIAHSALGIFTGVVRSVVNLTISARHMSEGFEALGRGFKRMNSPLALTIKSIALCILSIATAMWMVSKSFTNIANALNSSDLNTVLGSLGILLVICGLLVGIGAIFSKIKIEKSSLLTILALSFFVNSLASAFVSIAEVVKGSSLLETASSLGILIGMAVMLVKLGKVFSKIQVASSSATTILSLAVLLRIMASSFKVIAESLKGLSLAQTVTALGTLILMAVMLKKLGKAFSKITIQSSSITTILALSLMIFTISKVFANIVSAVSGANWKTVLGSVGILILISGMLVKLGKKFSKLKVQTKSWPGMIAMTIFISAVAKAFQNIAATISTSSLWSVLGSLGVLIVIAAMLTKVSKAFNDVHISIITVFGILTFSDFISDIGDVFVNSLESIKGAKGLEIIAALGVLVLIAGILVKVGKVFSDIAVDDEGWITILLITRYIRVTGETFTALQEAVKGSSLGEFLGAVGVLIAIVGSIILLGKVFSKVSITAQSLATIFMLSYFMKSIGTMFATIAEAIKGTNIATIAGSLVTVMVIAGLLMLVGLVFSKIRVQSSSVLTIFAITMFMKALGTAFSVIMDAISGHNWEKMAAGLAILTSMAGLLVVVGYVFSKIKIEPSSMMTIIALTLFMKALTTAFGAIMEVISGNDLSYILGSLGILVVLSGLLMLVGLAFSKIKIKPSSMATILMLSMFMRTLGTVFTSVMDAVSGNNWDKMAAGLAIIASMAGLLVVVGYVFSKIQVQSSSVMTIIALALFMKALGSVFVAVNEVISKSTLDQVEETLKVLLVIAGILTLVGAAFSYIKVQPSSLVTIVAMIVVMVEIAGALALLAYFSNEFGSLSEAVGAFIVALVGVSAALLIMSKINSGGHAVLAATSMAICAAAMIGMAYAMQMFNGVNWDTTMEAAIILGTMAIALAAMGAVGPLVVVAGAALVLAAGSLIAIAKAMQMFSTVSDKIGGGYLAGLAGSLMLLGLAGLVLAPGVIGLIGGALGVTAIAGALLLMGLVDPSVTGSRLTGLSAGLMMMGLAGVVLGFGAMGLLTASAGLATIGSALLIFNAIKINGSELQSYAIGLLEIAGVGLAGVVAGSGLIVLAAGISAMALAIWFLGNVLSSLVEESLPEVAKDATACGENVVKGAENGIVKETGSLLKTVDGLAVGMRDTFATELGIASPSTVFKKLGQWILKGLGLGVTDAAINSSLSDSMKGVADNLLSSFAGEMAAGFGSMGGLFDSLTKKTKKWVVDYEVMNQWGVKETHGHWEEEEESLFDDFTSMFGGLSESFNNLFSGDQFQGVSGLNDIFNGIDTSVGDLDFSTEDLTKDMSGLANGLDGVSDASKKTTKTFAENLNILTEFDRSLKTTVNDIEENMINRILGADQWKKYLQNLENMGYDLRLVKQIADMGMDSGYSFAAALNAAGTSAEEVARINQIFEEGYGKPGSKDSFDTWLANLDKKVEAGKEAVRKEENLIVTADMANGKAQTLAENIYNKDLVDTMLGDKAAADAATAGYNYYQNLLTGVESGTSALTEAEKEYKEKAANSEADAANYAMSYMAEAIKGAINKYMPADEFAVIGQNVCLGFGAGIMAYTAWPVEKVKQFAQAVIDAFCEVTKVESPSKVFERIGQYCTEGLAIGLDDSNKAEKSATSLGNTLTDLLYEQIAKIQEIMESDEEWQPVIKPVVDFTNLQAGADNARLMFNDMEIASAARDFSNYKIGTSMPESTLAGMSKDEFARFLTNFASNVVNAINGDEKEVTVNVNLEGDAKGIFRVVREENNTFKRATGYSALI